MMDRMTKAVIIGNPNSGRAGSKGYLEHCAKILRSGGLTVEVMIERLPVGAPAALGLPARRRDRIFHLRRLGGLSRAGSRSV